jgi:DNA-nicking Smr family endonuclease
MHRPFAVLEQWVRQGRIRLAAPIAAPSNGNGAGNGNGTAPLDDLIEDRAPSVPVLPPGLADEALFEFAMRDVKSLGWSAVPLVDRPPLELQAHDDEQQALRELEDFMLNGDIEIENTPEYIEGSSHPQGKLFLSDLRSGRFSIQAHLDMHGLTIADARFVLDEFVLESVRAGFTCVRVIHGRGHHSHKHEPVLKENIQRWLASKRMSRHVIAYTSARVCDGGGGAVYVLLRK